MIMDIGSARMQAQHIGTQHLRSVAQVVQHMGAMQAQDEHMCRWALGVRLDGIQIHEVEKALDEGKILRTHVLRPTWHLVHRQDAGWMLDLSAPALLRAVKARHRELEITPTLLAKSRKLVERLLAQTAFVSRNALHEAFAKARIATGDNRLSHILYVLELEKMIISGPSDNGRHTYAAFDQRVKKQPAIDRDEALARLALRYFTSPGPATVPDFAWWSGLNLTDAGKGAMAVKAQLNTFQTGSNVYYAAAQAKKTKMGIRLLPAFDEFLIAYRDRSAALQKQHQAQTLSSNGIFYPLVVANGQAVGTWKRSFKKNEVHVQLSLFAAAPKTWAAPLRKAAQAYAGFLGKTLRLL